MRRSQIAFATVFAVLSVLLGDAAAMADLSGSGRGIPANDRARGLVYDGLRRDARCPNGFATGSAESPACTHGPDPGPPGVDVRARDPLEAAATVAAEGDPAPQPDPAPAPLPCYGTGSDGNRVHVIYAHASDGPSAFAEAEPLIRGWVGGIDQAFALSGAKTGAERHVRWLMDSSCTLVVEDLLLPAAADDHFDATKDALIARGYTRTDRKYLVWMDAREPVGICGIADLYPDDTAALSNPNNGRYPMYARTDRGCWNYAEAHELMHLLGAVQDSAPHNFNNGHCYDGYDIMCYDYGTNHICPVEQEGLFDCNNDDYFSASPPAGSYLATHWNAARSSFLEETPVAGIPSATLSVGSSLASGFVATFDKPVKGLSTANFVVRTGTSTSNMTASLSCLTPSSSPVSCLLGPVGTAVLKPQDVTLLTGQSYTAFLPPTTHPAPVSWVAAESIPVASQVFRLTQQQETESSVTYGWRNVSTSSAYGGSYRRTRTKGATATFSYTGGTFTWYSIAGPDQGKATIYIDGEFFTTMDLNWPYLAYKASLRAEGIPYGKHSVKIVAGGAGKYTSIDAFKVGSTIYSTPTLATRWGRTLTSSASSGAYALDDQAGASVSFTFFGPTVDWYTLLGTGQGRASVYIDGTLKATVDNYYSSTRYGYRRRYSGLTNAKHTIKVVVLGTKRSASSGTRIVLDRFLTP